MLETTQYVLGLASGVVTGLSLGLVGGGGSILAVPLMVYLVGVGDVHVAIGTSALSVAISAMTGLANHASRHNVKWRCGVMLGTAGVFGAACGSTLGKLVNGQKLLFFFALAMLVVGALMLKARSAEGDVAAECTAGNAPKVVGFGLGSGLLSGFFGIGGGFLIVPSLMAATGMPVLLAVGTSLVAVAAFGLTTATSYWLNGLIDWPLALFFILGGAGGSAGGMRMAHRLNAQKGRLNMTFAMIIFVVAGYMIWRTVLVPASMHT